MKKIFHMLVVVLLLSSCGSQKDLAEMEAKRPSWAKSKPVVSGYYTGTGTAPKTGNPQYYQQVARNNALKDIAEEIAVTISSSSALRKMEFGNRFTQEYTSNVVTNSKQNLEGYKLVDTYEDAQYYFVYYRLSRSVFEEIRKERIEKAMAKAKSHLDSYEKFSARQEVFAALTEAIKALESIRPHLHESLETTYRGEKRFLGSHITKTLQQAFRDIHLRPVVPAATVVRGSGLKKDQLQFLVTTENEDPLHGFPVTANFSAQPLITNTALTSEEGIAAFAIEKVVSQSNRGVFQLYPDIETILDASTNDLLVKKIIRNMSLPVASIDVTITNPSFFIVTNEKFYGEKQDSRLLKNALRQKLNSRGFDIADTRMKANFVIEARANTTKGKVVQNMHVAWLSMQIEIFNQEGKLLYSHSEKDLKGIQLDYRSAANEAYMAAAKEIKAQIFDDFYFNHFR